MAYASILCNTCEFKNDWCYCSPNSVCSKYKYKKEDATKENIEEKKISKEEKQVHSGV